MLSDWQKAFESFRLVTLNQQLTFSKERSLDSNKSNFVQNEHQMNKVFFSTHSFAVISNISVKTVDLVSFPIWPTMDRPR